MKKSNKKILNKILNLLTGNNIKESKLKPATIKCLFLPFGHMLICRSSNFFFVKSEYCVSIYSKDKMFEVYGIKITEELIKDLSIK